MEGSETLTELRVTKFRAQGRWFLFSILILMALAALAPYILTFKIEGLLQVVIFIAYALIILIFAIAPFLRWISRTTLITNRRIVIKHGVFVRHRLEIPLVQINEIKLRRGPLQSIFRSGDILIKTVNGATLTLHNVPALKSLSKTLQELLVWQTAGLKQEPAPYGKI